MLILDPHTNDLFEHFLSMILTVETSRTTVAYCEHYRKNRLTSDEISEIADRLIRVFTHCKKLLESDKTNLGLYDKRARTSLRESKNLISQLESGEAKEKSLQVWNRMERFYISSVTPYSNMLPKYIPVHRYKPVQKNKIIAATIEDEPMKKKLATHHNMGGIHLLFNELSKQNLGNPTQAEAAASEHSNNPTSAPSGPRSG